MKRFLLVMIGLALGLITEAQTFNATTATAVYSAPSGGNFGPVSLTNVPPVPLGSATIEFFYRGDLDAATSTEYFDLIDENGSTIGRSNAATQCNPNYQSRTFTIPQATITNWAADGTIQFRFNAGTGVNGSTLCSQASGAYVTISYPYSPAPYDAGCFNLQPTAGSYVQTPVSQAQAVSFEATAMSTGDSTITGITVTMGITPSTYVDSFNVDTLLRQEDTTIAFPSPFIPTVAAEYQATAVVSMDQLDTVPLNDTSRYTLFVSDSVLARDDSSVTGGIGGTTPQEFGHMFTVTAPDTLTTVSFYLNNPTVGTSVRLKLYTFSDTALAGMPGPENLIDSSRTLTVNSSTAGWYTVEIGCGGKILSPGDYFVAINQLNPNNMGLGYTTFKNGTDTFLFLNFSQDTIGWRNAYHSTVNPLVTSITFLLRTNFGRVGQKNLLNDSAFYCNQSQVGIKPSGNWSTFSWSTGSSNDSINVGSAGMVSLSVVDEIGCSYSDSTQVLSRPAIQTSAGVTDATCGASDGEILANASGSTAPYSYNWSTGATGDSIGGLAGGTYDVTVTDGYGCESALGILVLGKNPVLSGAYTPPTCAGDNDGVATVSVVDGIPSYTYSWQGGGSTTDQLSGLSSGSYSVTVTDSSNCSGTISIDVVDPDTLVVGTQNSTNPSNCGANDGLARATVSGGVGPYSYFWSNGQNQQNNINLSTGTYDVTVTDALGCVRTGTVTLVDPNAPTVAGVGSMVTCSEDLGTVSVTVNGGTPPYQFSWDNGSLDSNQSSLPIGTYNVNVVDAAGCVKVGTAVVDGPDAMDVDFQIAYGPAGEGDTDVDAVITGANSPYSTYQWKTVNGTFTNPISGATTTTLNDALNGDYMIVVEDAQGCLDSAEVEVNNLSVGIVHNSLSRDLNVYPNPTNSKVNIIAKDLAGASLEIKVVDATGRIVGTNSVQSYQGEELQFDLSNQAEGIYMIHLQAGEHSAITRVQLIR
jgi:hypothetical protein